MIVCLALYLHSLFLVAVGQTIPEADSPSSVPDSEGDLLFLLDSSGSVSYHEFAKVKEFIGDLLGPFTFGPQDVQASIVHISTEPSLEFSFDQHGSSHEIQKAIRDTKQRMGDTNTGKAISYVKDNLSAGTFGSRADVPKVMVWVTDGLSTDDISKSMQFLKDLGVTVFIVSTGGGNYLELSEAASQPSEKHLHFVDVDDLPIITKELRDSIIDLIHSKRLHASDITTTSFRLTWPRLLMQREESYTLDYSLQSDKRWSVQKILTADQTGALVDNLTPNTTYWITLTPESNIQYFHPQTIKVTTLHEPIQEISLQVNNVTTTSFELTWPGLLSPLKDENYLLEYSLETDTSRTIQMVLSGDQTSMVLSNLTPNTTYRVKLTPKSNFRLVRPQTIQVSTLPEPIQEISLQVHDVTTTSFRLTWLGLQSRVKIQSFLLEYSLASDTSRTIKEILLGDQTSTVLANLTPNTTYRVTLIPKSNVHTIRPQTIHVSTVPEPIQEISLQVHDITSTSFRLSWPGLLSQVKGASYILEYSVESENSRTKQDILPGDQSSTVLSNLTPNTSYRVTLIPKSNVRIIRPKTIRVSTLPEHIQEIPLQVHDITTTSFRLTWPQLFSSSINEEFYLLEYAPESDIWRTIRKSLSGDQTSVELGDLNPNTIYRVTLTPKSSIINIRPKTILVSTLTERSQALQIKVHDLTSRSFRLTWPRVLDRVGEESYQLKYTLVSDVQRSTQRLLPADQTSFVLGNLVPNATYQVTLTPESNVKFIQPQTIRVSTLPEPIQSLQLRALDITPTSFRITWPRMLNQQEDRYLLEYSLESDLRRSVRKSLPGSQTEVLLGNLMPNTNYKVTLTPESNVQIIQPQTIQVSTRPERYAPLQILISEPTSNSFRVSWGPLLDGVASYEIQYGPLPSNTVYKVELDSNTNSTVLENLKTNTTYLVTVAARFKDGAEKALSAIACTEEKDVKVRYLHLEDLGSDRLKATWGSADGDVQGYRVRCRRQAGNSAVVNVAPQTHSTVFTDITAGSINKICVKPFYKDRAGKNLCRTVHIHPVTPAEGYPMLRT
ncbi:von Willebrand factor A domain-containing protein 1 isoform X1 [Pelobates fuscus]|uniref:von Willebrand factor A domain-containing protein 1 isoform X1 n=1 Tax=Pelobates fuscus TaxID=191477 RepID=UPI002FE4A0BD